MIHLREAEAREMLTNLVGVIEAARAEIRKVYPDDSIASHIDALELLPLIGILENADLTKQLKQIKFALGDPTEKYLQHYKEWTYSSNVKATIYVSEREALIVRYQSGVAFTYQGVPTAVWEALLKCESPGRFLAYNVRGKYACKQEAQPV